MTESDIIRTLSLLFAIGAWSPWFLGLRRPYRFGVSLGMRMLLALVPVLCLIFIRSVIGSHAALAVRADSSLETNYAQLGVLWVGLAARAVVFLGIDLRGDVLERRNRGAALVLMSAAAALAMCYAGGNAGEGPGLEAVLASAGAATLGFFLLWTAAEVFTGFAFSEAITVERSAWPALRLSGLLLANGAILGYAASGPWEHGAVWLPFLRFAMPAVILTSGAVIVERIFHDRLRAATSIAAAFIYPGVAAMFLAWAIRN